MAFIRPDAQMRAAQFAREAEPRDSEHLVDPFQSFSPA
jgi:hypothetical protein